MSVTAEDIRRQMAQAQAPQGITANEIRRRMAADRAAQFGTQTGGAPDVSDERGWVDRLRSGAAAVTEPWVKTLQGVEELTGADPETQAQTAQALDLVQSEAAKTEGRTAGNVLGEAAQMMLPASAAYRGAQAVTKGVPFLQRVAPITAESATVGMVDALKRPEEGETRLGTALKSAAANLVGAGVQTGISRVARPQMFERTPLAQSEMQMLRESGIEPDIPLSYGTRAKGPVSNVVRWMQRQPLRATPGFKQALERQGEKAIGDWREVMLRKALPEGADVPMPRTRTGEAPVDETLDAMDK